MEERTEMNASPIAGRERIMEILVFLLSEMRAKKALTEIDLKPLSQRGFSQTEISAAFSWLFDKLAVEVSAQDGPLVYSSPVLSRPSTSHRVLHDVERSVIEPDAQGYLMQMHELGLLNDFDHEFVIDRIMMAGIPSVSLEDVRDLVAATVFGYDETARPHSRVMLTASDRVQ
ncbi:MAG: DUF494 family protein [Bacteroidota bacterium]|nr:DUF494 family protein [Bacteroidota bacterium]MDP4232130.1 DUF494 family protein [Bacteroidota bacterium]MDP4241162.1 DUF494 family protein [Bacteroidota bacterium]MDP4286554.1 DUF494 family protein [Bacteroidota bacterium]